MDSQAWLWFSELVMLMKKSSHYFKAFYLFIYCFCHTYRPSKKNYATIDSKNEPSNLPFESDMASNIPDCAAKEKFKLL